MTDAVNRVLWSVLALALLAGGVFMALASTGRVPGTFEISPLLWPALVARWRDTGDAGPAAVAVLGVLAALAGVLLARAQLRSGLRTSMTDLRLQPGDDVGGVTRVRARTLSDALADDLERAATISRAGVALTGDADAPRMRARLLVPAGTEMRNVHHDVGTCLRRFAVTTGIRPDDVGLTVGIERGLRRVDAPRPGPRGVDGRHNDMPEAETPAAETPHTDGQRSDGHQADQRQADGRQADGRQADGRQADGHQADGQRVPAQDAHPDRPGRSPSAGSGRPRRADPGRRTGR